MRDSRRKRNYYGSSQGNQKRYRTSSSNYIRRPRSSTSTKNNKLSNHSTSRILTYADTTNTPPTSLAAVSKLEGCYRGNSLYDPDALLGGHQPWSFDQLMTIYKKFYVKGSIIDVYPSISPAQGPAYLMVWADTTSNIPTALSDMIETCKINAGTVVSMSGDTFIGNSVRMAHSTKNMLAGVKDDDKIGTVNSNPVSVWYWHVIMYNPNTSNAISTGFAASITYYTDFQEEYINTSS